MASKKKATRRPPAGLSRKATRRPAPAKKKAARRPAPAKKKAARRPAPAKKKATRRPAPAKKKATRRPAPAKKATRRPPAKRRPPAGRSRAATRRPRARVSTPFRTGIKATATRVREVRSALAQLEGGGRPGARILIGRTGWLTPSQGGLRALRRFADGMVRAAGGKPELYTFDMEFRHNGPAGERVDAPTIRNTILPSVDLARQERLEGESTGASMARLLEANVRGGVFRTMDTSFHNPKMPAHLKGSAGIMQKLAKAKNKRKAAAARRALNKFKAQRNFKFRLTVYRVIV